MTSTVAARAAMEGLGVQGRPISGLKAKVSVST
jgi:hypothetical protein